MRWLIFLALALPNEVFAKISPTIITEELPLKSERLVRVRQKIGDVWIRGAEKKMLRTTLALTIPLKSQELAPVSSSIAAKAELLDKNKLKIQSALEKLVPEWKSADRRFDPLLELEVKGGVRGVATYEYMDRNFSRLWRVRLDENGALLSKEELHPDSADGRGLVYPRGPKLSELKEDYLRDLFADGTLTGALISIRSAVNLNATASDLRFIYSEDDQRFEQVQVYYHMDKALRWMKDATGAEIRNPLRVKVRIGENGISNAAFYHQNEIYLGAGDGLVYKDMLKDPSIIMHETMHAIIDAYAGLPSEGEGGAFNEGMADLFTALILDTPNMAEASYQKAPYRRTLDNQYKAYQDFAPGVYRAGTIIASSFWDCREFLGRELTAQLALRTIVRLGAEAKFDQLWNAVQEAGAGFLTKEQMDKVQDAFQRRGWMGSHA